jgi:phosphate starvation-inducible PhoH-like protein
LPTGEKSGLIDVQERLKGVSGVDFVYLTRRDIVRHRLVRDIVDAYE